VITILLLIAGTVYGVFFHNTPPAPRQTAAVPAASGSGPPGGTSAGQGHEEGQTFTGIGRIRISTNDPQPGMVILFVSFPYHPNDKAFAEELASKIGDFRDIIEKYIGSFSSAELQKQDEEVIKAELLRRFNMLLRLGQIEHLFFTDFMIVG
jgi:flagellar basal body-associated protein FliL